MVRLSGEHDNLFAASGFPTRFRFDSSVAHVFDDMATRSIPLYRETMHYILELAEDLLTPGDLVYDLGSATGTLLELLSRRHGQVSFCGIDRSEAMCDIARQKLFERSNVTVDCADLVQYGFLPAKLVVANYTFQFLSWVGKRKLLENVARCLSPGSMLVISEKIVYEASDMDGLTTGIYENFKLAGGYSPEEIARKKQSLQNHMFPMTEENWSKLFTEAGLPQVATVIKWNNFVSFLCRV